MMHVCCVPWSRDGHGAVIEDGARLCPLSLPYLSVRWLRFARPWPGINASLLTLPKGALCPGTCVHIQRFFLLIV